MSSSSSRPRPRPRPKPKATQDAAQIASSSSSSPLKTVQLQVVDDDEMFMRNRNRSTGAWATLEKMTKEVKTTHNDSNSDEDNPTPKRKKAKKQQNPAVTQWQNKKSLTWLLSAEIPSSDSDDDIEIVGTTTTPRVSHASKRKRVRACSRSRSITPPPELPRQQVQHMRALVEQTLNTAPHAATRDDDDDVFDDDVFLNPDFARLAKSVEARQQSQLPPASSPGPDGAGTVQISVRWKPHPLNPEGKEDLWVFKMNRDDNFRDLFEATAEEAQIRQENLILSFEGKRIYASVTPMALQIWGEAELVGCDKTTYEYIRAHPVVPTPSFETSAIDIPSDTDDPPASQEDSNDKEQESDAEGETFKLILRSSAVTKDITLTVRPTTKCGAIVKAYLKKAGLAEQYPALFAEGGSTAKKGGKGKKGQIEKDPKLCVDGDRMGNDVEISEADLEDGDLVEVVGL